MWHVGRVGYVLDPPCPPNFMAYILDSLGRKLDLDDVAFVNRLIDLKKKSGSKPWPVIEEILKFWQKKSPSEWKSFLYEIQKMRNTRKEKKYASTKDKVHGGYLRYTLDIPSDVMYMMRMVYNATELPMNKEFFIEFARRFPRMKVAEQL